MYTFIDKARVQLPKKTETQPFEESCIQNHTMLHDIFCVSDGLKIMLEKSGDAIIQNMRYNGCSQSNHVVLFPV